MQGSTWQQQIAQIPAVNTHTHVYSHEQCQPEREVVAYLQRLYLGCMLPFADRQAAARVADAQRPDRERWRHLLTLWPYVKHTGFGRVVRLMFDSWGLRGELSDAAYDLARERLEQRSPDVSRRAFEAAGITHSIANVVGHSEREWESIAEFLTGRFPMDPAFSHLLSTVPLHTFRTSADIAQLGRVTGIDVTSLRDLERAVDVVIEGAVARGIVGLKNHCAYRRGLDIGPADPTRAEADVAALLAAKGKPVAGTVGLSDALFHRIIQRAADFNLPVAIHTGMLAANAHPRTNVALLAPVFEAYPQVRFDLFHLNYPWVEDGLAILKRFPNTWANCAWTHIVDPHAVVEFLRRAIGTIPVNHVFGFGSDGWVLPEPGVAHLAIARANVATALAGAIEQGHCGESDALEIARLWLHGNAMAFYRLPSPPSAGSATT